MNSLFYKILAKIYPTKYIKIYDLKAKKIGLKKIYFLISLDCDTDEDSLVVENLVTRLKALKIKVAIAAPAQIILRNINVYKKLANSGAEFMNHGFEDHAVFNKAKNKYISKTFYKNMKQNEIFNDITKAHETIFDKLNIEPKGFRTPHFGTIQNPIFIDTLHRFLYKLNYKWSSSTIPTYGLHKGPLFQNHGITEIPLSGFGTVPSRLVDSWSFYDQEKKILKKSFFCELQKSKETFQNLGNGIINLYFDPIHVYKSSKIVSVLNKFLKISQPESFSSICFYAKS